MPFTLRPQIHAAACGEDLVILDLASGDYACAPGLAARLSLSPSDNRVTFERADLADDLMAAGLLVRDGVVEPRRLPPPPDRDLGWVTHTPADLRAKTRMLGATCEMLGAFWRPSFAQLVARAAARQSKPLRQADPDTLAHHARQFAHLLPWAPFQGDCLFRSVMLQLYLRRWGLASSLVVGVQTWPFEAHCWVQAGGVLLDDGLDHVLGFRPILAIGA